MSKFQITVLGIFVLFIVIGIITFARYKSPDSVTRLPTITVWGTFPVNTFNDYVDSVSKELPTALSVNYEYKSPDKFSSDFISALARGQGPDVILITADSILQHLDKITPIPSTALLERDFKNKFIQEGELYYSSSAGAYGIPFSIDPIVMYWNRDMYSAAGLATYPRNWEDFTELNKRITKKTESGTILKSAIAMGDFGNVNNAREILGSLLFQIGNPVTFTNSDGRVKTSINTDSGYVDTVPVFNFFTKFVDPSNIDYSWNKGMTQSKLAFLAGNLATYFGFASEIADLRQKNPNLNFDVAPLPQVKTGGTKATYGKMFGFSIVKSSLNANAAYQVISILTDTSRIAQLSNNTYLPSVDRQVINQGSSDPYITIFNQSALVAKSWLDVDTNTSKQLFGNIVDNITSGKKDALDSINDGADQYDIILEQLYQ